MDILKLFQRRHIAVAAVLAAAVVALRRLLRPKPKRFREVPSSFLLGVSPQADFCKKVDEWAAQHGQEGAYEMNMMGHRVVVVCDWENAQRVLAMRPVRMTKPKQYRNIGRLANGVLFSDGEMWKRERRLMAPHFNSRNIEEYAPAIDKIADRLLATLEEDNNTNQAANFSQLLGRFAADVIMKVASGLDHGILNDINSPIVKDTQTMLDGVMMRLLAPFPYWKVPGLGNAIDGADRAADRLAEAMVEGMNQMAGSGAATIAEKLRESQETMCLDELSGNLRVLLVAGTHTTSKTLSWAFYYLARDTELQDRVAIEIQAQLPNGTVSPGHLNALPLVNAVWLETLRVKMPAPFEEFHNDEPVTIAGREVPAGTDIYVLYRYLLHSASEVKKALGDDLDKFRPERWLAVDGGFIKLPPFDTFAFGHGPRICLGMRLADYEGRLVIAKVLKRFRLKQWEGPELAERDSFFLEPAADVKIGIEVRT